MDLRHGLTDLFDGWRRRQVALYFAWTETLARYRRSFLGPLWLVFSTLIGVVGLGFIWSALLKVDQSEFIPSLAVGLVTWQMISGSLSEAPGVFTRARGTILNIRLPSFLFSQQLLFRHLINFAHNLIVLAVVFAFYPGRLQPLMVLVLPGLLVVSLSLLGVIHLLGFFGARFRDLEPLVASFLPILFFLSPVIYQSRQLGGMEYIMHFNLVAHWIGIIRDPVLGTAPAFGSYVAALVALAVIWFAALWVTSARGHRLPYWV